VAERKSISKKLRFEVFKRDSFTCQYCGKSAPEVVLEADHITPVSKGGKNTITNLITACFDCNRGKSDKKLTENQTVKAQKKELDKLNERKEQLEMMAKWQMELIDIEKREAEKIIELVNMRYKLNVSLTDKGIKDMISLIKKYSFNEVLESAIISFGQYKDVEEAFKKIKVICNMRKTDKEKPYMKDLYYIRGILRNRFSYVDENYTLSLLKRAYELGNSIEDLKEHALSSKSWDKWSETTEMFIEYKESVGDE
jgi:hypothetical protein